MLLALRPRSGKVRREKRLGFALYASELLDLGLLGRIEVANGSGAIVVVDQRRTEDRRLNNVLARLERARPRTTAAEWLRGTPRSTVREYLSRLEDQKTLKVHRPSQSAARYGGLPRVTLRDRARLRAVRARLDAVARGTASASAKVRPADLALVTLVRACGLDRRLYRGPLGPLRRRRLARVLERQPATSSVRSAAVPADAEGVRLIARWIDDAAAELNRRLADELRGGYDSTSNWTSYT